MENKNIQIFLLLILPGIFFLLSIICQTSKGEFYLINRYDPSYIYLLNSLNVSRLNGLGVGHIDHPGTTVQEIGASVIYLLHLSSADKKDVVADVFNRPEFYLSNINLVFLLLNSIALFILGFVSLKKLKDVRPAILLQITPLFSISIYTWIINVSPEPLLIFDVLLMITVIVSYTFEKDLKSKTLLKYAILFGLIAGFGLATKISFFPLILIPVILIKKFSFKLLFCLVTFIAFLIIVYPAISPDNPYRFINWIRKLVTHSGKYGTGEKNFIDVSGIPKSFVSIFTNEPIFVFSYIIVFAAFLLQLIPRFRQKIKSNKYYKLLIAIFLTMTVQVFIVIKHFELHYLIPAYLLIVLGLFIVNSIAGNLFPKYFKRSKYLYLCSVLLIFSIIQCTLFLKTISEYSKIRNASHDTIEFIEKNYKQSLIVSSYGSSNKEFALYLGATLSGAPKYEYYSILKNMFPNNYYYDKWSKNLENVDRLNDLKDNFINAKKFVFECNDEMVLNDFLEVIKKITGKQDLLVKKVFTGAIGESIYEVSFSQN